MRTGEKKILKKTLPLKRGIPATLDYNLSMVDANL